MFPLLKQAEALRPLPGLQFPVYRGDYDEYGLFYAPGYLGLVHPTDAERFQEIIVSASRSGAPVCDDSSPGTQGAAVGQMLSAMAARALREAAAQQTAPFRPKCLTLYPQNDCNLRCLYCQNERGALPGVRLDEETITAAAILVAEQCQRLGSTFCAVFHGGGEPMLDRDRLARMVDIIMGVAEARGVACFRYVATNGVMSVADAIWMAQYFELVGLSCDGPPDIQDRQRPRRGGESTAAAVERTARILHQEGARFHVRTTITAATARRQVEIAEYLCQVLAPEEIRFEPVYRGHRTAEAAAIAAPLAGEYVAQFLLAQHAAGAYGVPLSHSGSRPASLHGPYCNVFRQVLNLTPAGWASACFDAVDATAHQRPVAIGALNRTTGRYEIEYGAVDRLRQRLAYTSDRCAGCFNNHHCVRECPDDCPLDHSAHIDRDDTAAEPGLRCLVHKALAFARLQAAVDACWSAGAQFWGKAGEIRAYGIPVV